MNDKIKQMLRDLGSAINESISASEDVNRHLELIRAEGYELYVVLDATIGLNKQEPAGERLALSPAVLTGEERDVQFRINVGDLSLLRSLGIDPTRKVKTVRRVEQIGQSSGDE